MISISIYGYQTRDGSVSSCRLVPALLLPALLLLLQYNNQFDCFSLCNVSNHLDQSRRQEQETLKKQAEDPILLYPPGMSHVE